MGLFKSVAPRIGQTSRRLHKNSITMGRMHSGGKGISQSALPYRRTVPNWLKLTKDDVEDQIVKLAKKGLTPSQIGVILRDSHGVAQVRFVTGNKILRVLKAKGLAPDIPEDLYHLIKKAVAIRKHLKETGKTVTPNSVLFWSNQGSTDWPATTRPVVFSHQYGNTRVQLLVPLLLK